MAAWLSPSAGQAQAEADARAGQTAANPEAARQQRLSLCARLAAIDFPTTSRERQAALERLESVRDACNDHPAFLALLGGLWLEQGDSARALLWLERALMLSPELPAARADHALALASLGDFTARNELVHQWRDRQDVPPLVWARLMNTVPKPALAASSSPWIRLRELALLVGHESNLDHSPRLDELTITPPDGPTTLPLSEPLRPRPGAAALLDASWQVAYNAGGGLRLQSGVQAAARSSPDQSSTDWHSLQLVVSASQAWRGLRGQLQWGYTALGGRLNEPYGLSRWGLSVENNGLGCQQRGALDHEIRRQRSTALHDSASTGLSASLQCPLPVAEEWALGLALRAVIDRPRDPLRPGGEQRQLGGAIRLGGPVMADWRMEASLRYSRTLDRLGYSDLLANEARRWMEVRQLQLEFTKPMYRNEGGDAHWVVQLHAIGQTSNIPIFEYSSYGAFGGLRWRW